MDTDPDAAAVVAVAGARITPTVLLAIFPLPVVVVDAKLEARIVVPAFLHAPAIAVVAQTTAADEADALNERAAAPANITLARAFILLLLVVIVGRNSCGDAKRVAAAVVQPLSP